VQGNWRQLHFLIRLLLLLLDHQWLLLMMQSVVQLYCFPLALELLLLLPVEVSWPLTQLLSPGALAAVRCRTAL
jgi:hypothetical protein